MNSITKFTLLTLISLTIAIKASSQNDTVMSLGLEEARVYAIENFYVTKNTRLDVESAKKRVWETTAIGLPQVSATAGYQHILGDIPEFSMDSAFAGIFGAFSQLYGFHGEEFSPPPEEDSPSTIAERDNITYGLTVSQLVFSGEYLVGLQASKAYKSLSVQVNEKTEMTIKSMVSDSYYGILVLKQNKEIINKTLGNVKENYDQTQKMFDAGLLEETDLDQLELTLTELENNLRSIDRQLMVLENLFKYQLGLPKEATVELTDSLDQIIEQNIISEQSYNLNLEENIDYQLLETNEKLMDLSQKRVKSTFLPTLSAFYRYDDKWKEPGFDFTIKHIVGVNLEVPIFSSGMRLAKLSQAKIDLEKAINEKEQEAVRIAVEAEQAKYDYATALDNYKSKKKSYKLSEKILNKSDIRFKEGIISSLDLTTINNQFLQARLEYALATQQLLNAKVKLDMAHSTL